MPHQDKIEDMIEDKLTEMLKAQNKGEPTNIMFRNICQFFYQQGVEDERERLMDLDRSRDE